MKIGIATCAEKSDLSLGDQLLVAELKKLGHEVNPLIWTQAKSFEGDALVIRSTWDYHLHFQDFTRWLSRISRSGVRLLNSYETIRWNLDKAYLIELSRLVDCVPSLLVHKAEASADILAKIKDRGWEEVVIKPTISATAFLTFKASIFSGDLLKSIRKVQEHSDVLVQPFIASVVDQGEASLIFYRARDIQYSHAVLKNPRAGDFRVQSDFGGAVQKFAPARSLIELAEKALRSVVGDWAFARVDFIDWQTQPLVGEIELIEPDLFLDGNPEQAHNLATVITEKLQIR